MAGNNNEVAAAKLFKLEVITPQRSVFSGDVESLTAPGTLGSFQVLHDHAPFLTTIGVGEVKLVDQSGNESVYSTSGGFVEVKHNNVSFLADTLERKDEINVKRAEASRDRAQGRLAAKEAGIDLARARAALARALNRLRVAEK